MRIFIILLLSYLLGAIPSAFLVTRLVSGKDVREYGSGNVGATNASRVLGLGYGIMVGIFDILKGFIAVHITYILLPVDAPIYYFLLAGLLAIIGHNWSLFLGFTGGKGVATTFGVILRLYPLIFLIYATIWFLVVFFTKYVSLASMLGALSLPILSLLFFKGDELVFYLIFSFVLTLFIFVRHHSNIKRLLAGKEKKVNGSSLTKKSDL